VRPIPFLGGTAIVNGLASIQVDEGVEGFARAPFPLAGDLQVGTYSLRDLQDRARLLEQTYDFSCGELTTVWQFAAPDATVSARTLTFCSRSRPTLCLQETELSVDRPCRLRLAAMVDPAEVPGRFKVREAQVPAGGNEYVDGCLEWATPGELTTCGAAYHTSFAGPAEATKTKEARNSLAPLTTAYEFGAVPGETYRLRQLTSLVTSQANDLPHREATRLAAAGALVGHESLRADNRATWQDLWRGRVVLLGADRSWQARADAAYYYLHASAHASSLYSTSMFGLAYWPNYHYYRGQVMWDIEAFALPALLLSAPAAAHALLKFRLRHVNAAEQNAALNGYRGLQFAWAASPLTGQEAVRTDAPLVTLEQHVNMAVAHAFALYANVTGDAEFARDSAWEILRGVALWIQSRADETERGLEIRHTLGFAEQRRSPVDNDAYVNMAAAVVLNEAADLAERLEQRPEAAAWRAAAERLHLPIDSQRGVVRNHDRFTPEEDGVAGAVPEALGGLFPFGYRLDPQTERSTIDFYLGRVEPYLGYPMFNAPLGVFAAWNGDRTRSAELFQAGFGDYFNAPFGEIDEYSRARNPEKPVVGPFTANLGGFLTSCLYGLPRMFPDPGEPAGWFRGAAAMPELWDAVEVERLWIRGAASSLRARHGMVAELA
jgi:glycosyl hydrolase family 65